MMIKTVLCYLILATVVGSACAAPKAPIVVPDFTKGGTIPKGSKHDWNLGPTGLRGWIYCDKMVTTDARQILITRVDKGSPAEAEFMIGDVLLGVGGKPFTHDPRTELGKAITVAESKAGQGKLLLTRWRAGETKDVIVQLPVLGDYSNTAPYGCTKSQLLLEEGCKALASRMGKPGYADQDPIVRSLNALALLASGKSEYLALVKKEAQWAAEFKANSMQTWHYGYCILLLAEYVSATGDQSVMPGLKRLAVAAANGQSAVGSWGHGFAIPDGRLRGYGMMNSPGLVLTISLVIAREAGVTEPQVSRAIELSARLLRFYTGKGAIPYGDHHPWTETHDDNGKCGMGAVLFNLLGEDSPATFFSRMSVASHGSERDCGHTGNYFNMLWAIPGVAQSGPKATGAWMKEFGTWYFDFARRWDGSYQHQGPPEPEHDSYEGWDSTATYLLAYAMPLKKIHLTGKSKGVVPQLVEAAAESLINDGRGWTNKDRHSSYDKLTTKELLDRLSSWSPVVRERAAVAMARHKDADITPLLKLLDSSDLYARYGACEALGELGKRGAPAVEVLAKTLEDKDLWLRIKAAEAIAKMGSAATPLVPKLLELLADVDKTNDPRGMQQRYLSFALFDSRGLLGRSVDGVDREALYKAVRVGLKNQDGRARGSIGSIYRNLSAKDIKPLLPAIYQAIVEPAPSGEMFADEIRVEGLRLFAKYHIDEGIQACVQYARQQNPWASEKRTPELMKILLSYGTHAKVVVPELEKLANYFEKDEPNFPKALMKQKAKCVRDTILAIQSSKETPELTKLDPEVSKTIKRMEPIKTPQQGEMAGYLLVPHEKVDKSFNGGFSTYVAAWPLLKNYPGSQFQSGLFGTWMFAQYDGPKPQEKMYSDIEGGLGWWRDTRFATETPKFIMGGVALNFSAWANGPGAGVGRDFSKPRGHYAIAQLSPWVLWPPDGLNLKQGTNGELFGYGYLPLPLTQAKKNTGNNCWTCFLNTGNFKGPVTFFLPNFWSAPTIDKPNLSGMFLDTKPSEPNKAVQMETQHIPAFVATDSKGDTYARIAPTQFPGTPDTETPLVHRMTAYNKAALWDSVQAWFDGGKEASGVIDVKQSATHTFKGGGGATWQIYADGTAKEKKVNVAWNSFANPTAVNDTTFGYKWTKELVRKDTGVVTLPEYYRLGKNKNGKDQWQVIDAKDVPAETGLAKKEFPRVAPSDQKPYVTPDDAMSSWKKPGPVAGPFEVKLADGSTLTYSWYRFADQPALLNADMTDAEREALQKKIEMLHKAWTKDREYLPAPTLGKLAELDPALLVMPPNGYEIGYVPIVTRQGFKK